MSYPRMVEFEPTTKPLKKPIKERLQDYIFNEETNTIFGRTPDSWAKLIIFYVIFYGALAALMAFCMWAFFQTLDPRTPTLRLERSLIGANPGLGFRPRPPEKDVESTLIYYKGTKDEDFAYWKNDLVEFLKVYRYPGLTPGRGQNINNCDYDKPPKKGQVCDMDVKNLDPCTEENKFNFHKSGPCIFLKLNKIYGWIPEYYNQTNELPEDMPAQLKDYIASEGRKHAKYLNTVWISCEGENPADVENIGRIAYYPRQGFPGYFYPYENSEGYLSPLVALHIEQPTNGIIINIECKAWAKNIVHNRQDRIGSVHFELMID